MIKQPNTCYIAFRRIITSFEMTELHVLIRLIRNRENEISSPTNEAALLYELLFMITLSG